MWQTGHLSADIELVFSVDISITEVCHDNLSHVSDHQSAYNNNNL